MANKLNSNFAGGMNSHTSPLIIKDNEAELIVNYNLDKLGALTRRNGYEIFATQPVANKTICGLIGVFGANNRGNYQWMSVNNAGATNRVTYYNNAGTWTATDDTTGTAFDPNGAANAVHPTRFVNFLNYVFRLTGADTPKSFLVTTPQTATTTNLVDDDTSAALAITPSVGAVFQDRLYFNYVADNYNSRVYYSSLPSTAAPQVITFDTDATTGRWFSVNPDDGDFITAFENNGNRLLIFKNWSMYRWTFGQVEPDRLIGVGAINQEVVKTNFDVGITFFANPRGVYAYSGERPKLISRKIQEYIDAVTSANWKYAAGGIDNDHYYLSVGDITVNGKTIPNAVFVYHISLDAWAIYSMGVKPTVFAEMSSTYPTKVSRFGSTDGRTYTMNTGTSDSVGGAVTSIAAEVIFKEHLISFPQRTNLTFIDIFADQRVESNVFYDVDRRNEFKLIGSLTDRITNFTKMPQRECNSVRLKIADNSKDVSVISGYNIEHEPKEKRDEVTYKIKKRDAI